MKIRGIENKKRYKVTTIILLLFVLVFTSACTKGGTQEAKQAYRPTKLVVWGVWENEDDLRVLFDSYRAKRPNVTIEYRKFRYENYEQELLEAMADDRGPDVFAVHNTWMQRYKDRLEPIPSRIVIPVKYMKGSIKKEEVTELVPQKVITPLEVKQNYLDVVSEDALIEYNTAKSGQPERMAVGVFGLPIYLDNMVMFYNKDLLNNAGIVEPPSNWIDFQDAVKRITKIDASSGQILVSGAALGTANNVPRSFDILSLLMMQNLTPMIDSRGRAAFNKRSQVVESDTLPGLGALEYYVQFASPLYEGYSWNASMPDAFEMFKQGKVGFFFGYSYHRDNIEGTASKLNYAIAPVPQVGEQQKVNYASYWLEVVSKKTDNAQYAWDFVQFITKEENVSSYLNSNKKPTALRSTKLVNEQLADEELTVFADQLFTSYSWFKGQDSAAAEEVFADLITTTLSGDMPSEKALNQAATQMNSALRGY